MSIGGDYIGFTYNDIHSSTLGIIRTSDGSRYSDSLLPTSQDKTAVRTGSDGTMYWGSNYTQKQFSVSYAFDSLTEEQLGQLKVVFGDKGVHELIFDEAPYKVYRAKVTGTASLSYLAFEEGETGRVYKGTGSVQFTCFQPFARSRAKFGEEYTESNRGEWIGASRMKMTRDQLDELISEAGAGGHFNLYNAGDMETDFKLVVKIDEVAQCESISIEGVGTLGIKNIAAKDGDSYVLINSAINLIEGLDENKNKTGKIYNEYITSGDFFKIPRGESTLNIQSGSALSKDTTTIEYDYLYY